MISQPGNTRLRVASYNVHSWRGTDGKTSPDRVIDVIRSLDADVVALQEVVSPRLAGSPCSLEEFASCSGYHVTFGQTMLRPDSSYGNALLNRRDPIHVAQHDLSYTGREPRGAIEAHYDYDGTTVKVVATHLGLKGREKVDQMRLLARLLSPDGADMILVMGDFNDWCCISGVRRQLRALFGAQHEPRTFPSRCPLFPLDKIRILPRTRLAALHAVRNACTRVASDHLPLVADIRLGHRIDPETAAPTLLSLL